MAKEKTTTKTSCYHCGEPCEANAIAIDEKSFCCQGCKAVYQLLNSHDLDTYYTIEQNPGIKTSDQSFNHDRFAYLDDLSIKSKLYEFSDDSVNRITFYIPQMHCSSCLWLLENLYRLNDGVHSSRVVFLEKKLTVVFDETKLTLSKLAALLASLGYEPTINLDNLKDKSDPKTNRSLSYKLAVAGFSFANIMLFSFPEYLDSTGEVASDLKELFWYLNIFLSLPVLFYSSNEFLISAYKGLKQKVINMDVPISMGIIILFLRSLYEVLIANQAGYFDSFAGLVFFLLIGRAFQKKTYDTLSFDRDYKSFFPLSVTCLKNKIEETIPITKLEIGDKIIIRNQELIPADSILMDAQGMIDYSFVTGEANPVQKKNGDLLYAGGRLIGKSIIAEIVKEVSQSYLTQLWNEKIPNSKESKSLTTLANRIAKQFTIVIISIAIATALVWYFIDPVKAITSATAVLIIACPCALALSTPFTLGTVLRIFGRNKFYLKNIETIESLASVDTIVFDKTGTLTTSSGSEITFHGDELNEYEQRIIKSVVRQSAHPLSLRIYNKLTSKYDLFEISNFEEKTGKGIIAEADGQVIQIGSISWLGISDKFSNDINNQTAVGVLINDKVRGLFKFSNVYRNGVDKVVKMLKEKYKLALLSGDNESEQAQIEKILGENADIHFNCSPHDKFDYINKLENDNHRVLMLGDGLNDAGALYKSNVGVAISDDTALFTPASDGILDAESFNKLHSFIEISQKSLTIIKASFVISFLYNIVGLSFATAGMLSPLFSAVLMPLSSISVVLFTTLTTTYFARKIGLK